MVRHYDANGKRRIAAATVAAGQAGIQHFDATGKMRITAGTSPSGHAQLIVQDADRKIVGHVP